MQNWSEAVHASICSINLWGQNAQCLVPVLCQESRAFNSRDWLLRIADLWTLSPS